MNNQQHLKVNPQVNLYQDLSKLQQEAYMKCYPTNQYMPNTYGQSQITNGFGTLPTVRYTSSDPLGMDFHGYRFP